MMQRFLLLFTTIVCSATWGCGDSDNTPETVPVVGTITLDGEPVPDAEVRFLKDGFAGVGITGPDGSYELSPGAIPGTNQVTVSKIVGEGMSMDPEEGMDAGQMEAAMTDNPEVAGVAISDSGPQQVIPAQYSTPGDSELSFDVPPEGSETADFNLVSE